MKYVNDTVRRQDRLMDEERALELLRESEYGVLSMQDVDGSGYGVPLNYVWDGDHSIYIHCAPEGHKLQALECRSASLDACICCHATSPQSMRASSCGVRRISISLPKR